mgnify:CR=1 FL=1
MSQGDGQAPTGELTFKTMINEPAKHLFHFMVMNETHALVFGAVGTGKTTLIKNALMNVPSDYAVVVFDITGSYEGYTDYHAPYPLNPLNHLNAVEVLDVLGEVLTMRFPRLSYVMTPAMEHMFMNAYTELTTKESEAEATIGDVIKHLDESIKSGAIAREDEANSARGLIRRLQYFNHWAFQRTHPIINRLLKGELRGRSIGIDLRWLSPIQRWFYVLSFLAAANAVDARNVIFVIDEAHLYLRLGESTLTLSLRIGRNSNRYFALITQSPFDVPREFISMNKLFVAFPTMFFEPENVVFREVGLNAYFGRDEFYRSRGLSDKAVAPPHHWEPLTALMHIHITNKQLYEMTAEKKPYLELWVKADPTIPPKPNATTLKRCATINGIEISIVKEHGFTYKNLQDRLGGVWECIGTP